MENKLYIKVLESKFLLGGIKAIKHRYYYLRLIESDGTYEITKGMRYGDTWCGFGKKKDNPITHINFVNDYLSKGYIELTSNPILY